MPSCARFTDAPISYHAVVHAVHKCPTRWGWHRAGCAHADAPPGARPGATCSCGGSGGGSPSSVLSAAADADLPVAEARQQPDSDVEALQLPLPRALEAAALGAGAALSAHSGGGCLRLWYRADFLPMWRADDGGVRWLVSEVEGMWCELFLRAAPQRADAIVEALGAACKVIDNTATRSVH